MTIFVGDVLHLYFTTIHPPNYKYCIVIRTTPRILCVLINSDLTEFAKSTAGVVETHAPIYAEECGPLRKPKSWIGCADHFGLDLEMVVETLAENPEFHCGRVSREVAQRIVDAMKHAYMLSPRKRLLGTEQLVDAFGLPVPDIS